MFKTDTNETLPDFLCLGTYRAGTTWLQALLQEHPEVFLPVEKETMFFSHYYGRGLGWYAEFFRKVEAGCVPGEICPTYLASDEAPARIKAHLPEVKLIAILRSPVDQIVSLYKLWLMRGYTKKPFGETVRTEPEFINNVLYHRNISRYLDLFPKDKFLILFYEDLKSNPDAFFQQVTDYLGLSIYVPEKLDAKVNASGAPKIKIVDKLLASTGDFMRRNNLYAIKRIISRSGVVDVVKRINMGNSMAAPPEDEGARFIVDQVAEDITKLAGLTNRDLSHWLTLDNE